MQASELEVVDHLEEGREGRGVVGVGEKELASSVSQAVDLLAQTTLEVEVDVQTGQSLPV
jgi:hypothetical protein